MQTIGDYLKSEREARDISLKEVARLTKISEWYLDSLEKDDLEKIPGGPYIKGYIHSYASYIGLDADDALERYDSTLADGDKTSQISYEIAVDRKKGWLPGSWIKKIGLLFAAFTMLILLGSGSYFWVSHSKSGDPVAADHQAAEESAEPAPIAIPDENNELLKTAISSIPSAGKQTSTEKIDLHHRKIPAVDDTVNAAPLPSERHESSDRDIPIPQGTISKPSPPAVIAAPAVKADAAELHPENAIQVLEATACADVRNRIPAGKGSSFHWTSHRVYIWTLLKYPNPPESIKHVYYFNDKKVNEISLNINGPLWRTWSYKTLSKKRFIGQWRVDITSSEGKLLQSVPFVVN